jgi:hypothetical protein
MFRKTHMANAGLAGLLVATMAGTQLTGCEDLPGGRKEQGAVIGGAAGAAAGAILAEDNRLLGALIGGALGAGAGYIIGAETDWFDDDDDDVEGEVNESARAAQYDPATVAEARAAADADINNDGFVTLDEVIAMEQAGFTDSEMLDRLEATGHIFDLNASQRQHLLDNGVSRNVVNEMVDINRAERDRILSDRRGDDVISEEDDGMYDD